MTSLSARRLELLVLELERPSATVLHVSDDYFSAPRRRFCVLDDRLGWFFGLTGGRVLASDVH